MKPPVSLRRRAEQPIPTARQTLVRMIPGCAVLMFGIPGAALALPADAAQDDRMPWALLITTAALLLSVIVHRVIRASRPRQDIEVDGAQRRRALAAASQTGEVPTDPAVRVTTGVAACQNIEGFAMMVTALVGTLIGAMVRPELEGWFVWGPMLVGSIAAAFRLRSSIAYLHALRLAPQAN